MFWHSRGATSDLEGGFGGSPPFEEATSTPGTGVGGNTVVPYDDSAPFSSDKIRAKSSRILSAATTIDGWPGAWYDALAPCMG